jgi:hypothetical protein
MRLVRHTVLFGILVTCGVSTGGAQAIDAPGVGSRVAVQSCAGSDGRREMHHGQLRSLNDSGLVMVGIGGRDVLPMSRVLDAQLNTKRSRELEGVGVLAGIGAGLYSLRVLVGGKDTGGGVIVAIPVAAVIGGAVGYVVGGRLSGREEWSPLPLPPGHGAACED